MQPFVQSVQGLLKLERKRRWLSVAVAVSGVLASLTAVTSHAKAKSHVSRASQAATASPEVIRQVDDAWVRKIKMQIAGEELEPAGKVFTNIQMPHLKNIPASAFLDVMNNQYSRALGVACTHCHVEGNFASDQKRPKRAARDMAAMHRSINEQLSKMQYLSPSPAGHVINCMTCHRGSIDPVATIKSDEAAVR